ncbi:MAG: AMP-binding protein [Gammaproteobacteria bacterium]|nr:AMP-binding protein [Gammaproteobacteria bacterium]
MTDPQLNQLHEQKAQQLLMLVRELVIELHPHLQDSVMVRLDSHLDRDLSFDSLGRAELLLRVDKAFKVHLPEALIAEAETPGDLLQALLAATHEKIDNLQQLAIEVEQIDDSELPAHANTLSEVMQAHVEMHGERKHLCLWQSFDAADCMSYRQLHEAACKVAAGLLQAGLSPGQRIAIMLPTEADFFKAFLGVIYAGGVAVPIYPPLRRSQVEEHLRRQAGILNNAQAKILITVAELRQVGTLLYGLSKHLRQVQTVAGLSQQNLTINPLQLNAEDPALIQYTSGSTGDPKGVVLTHANLLANIRAMGKMLRVTSNDVFVSWLPLYHDMGLIGAWFGSMYFAVPVLIMSPLTFLADPSRWLWAIHHFRATLTAAPNFAYELCLKNIRDEDIQGLDLSSLRLMLNGAEPVSPNTISRFSHRFQAFGLAETALIPVYGLAENSVGLAFPPAERTPIVDHIDRDQLAQHGRALPVDESHPHRLEFVACGQPLPGHEVKILDDSGRELPDRQQGRLAFKGPSATAGYFRNQQKTRELRNGDWLDSGDLAYIVAGEIFITGRIKDIIIRAGRNIYPHELEELIGNIDGVRKGCVAVFPSTDQRSGSERLIVMAETRLTDDQQLTDLRQRIMHESSALLEMPPDDILLAPPRSVPKTSSGKIRRSSARAIYESGEIGEKGRSLWWQLTRLGLIGSRQHLLRASRKLGAYLYAGYWWSLLLLLAVPTWITAMLLPRRSLRQALNHRAARLFLKLAGHKLSVENADSLAIEQVMLVVNHASYLDGLVLTAAIPGQLSFVAKHELKQQWVAGLFLKRIGTLFVRRWDTSGGIEDTTGILQAAAKGQRIVSFPEGTFSRMPGLLGFHMGAFVVAARASMPIQTVTIRGTRSILRSGQWFPHRGEINLHIGRVITADGDDFEAAVGLRDQARSEILQHCHEPDLAHERFIPPINQ